jgi:hypothetical protein
MEYKLNKEAKFINLLNESIHDIKIEEWKKQDNQKEKEKVEDVMKDLEKKVNPKSIQEGISKLATAVATNDLSGLLGPMERGSKEFEERVGRPMTYSEMRSMWG